MEYGQDYLALSSRQTAKFSALHSEIRRLVSALDPDQPASYHAAVEKLATYVEKHWDTRSATQEENRQKLIEACARLLLRRA